MKLGLKRKIVLVFIGMLIVVSALDTLLASYFTKRQNQDAAFATLKRDLLTWQDELQALTEHLRSVALSAIDETVALSQLSVLKALDYKLAEAVDKNKEVKEAARTLAFSKAVSLNRLHLVLRSGGFSSIAVYIDGKLSHRVSESEVGMFVQRGNGEQVWVKAAADDSGNLPIRNWPAWQQRALPVAASLPPVERPQVTFAYPSADSMIIEVAVPVEGIMDYSLQQGELHPPELSVIEPHIAGSASDPSVFAVNRPSTPFATVVFQKRIDLAFLQAVERKTGMWPLLFSPDGRQHQQLGPLNLSLQQLLTDTMPDASAIKSQTVFTEQGSFYAAALPWQFERQPGFVLALVSSMDSTLHNIRQTVAAILTVTGLILAFSIGIGIFWVGRIIDPIVALTNAVKAIGLVSRLERGRQSDERLTIENLRPLAISAPGEIGELAWAFDSMIGELHASFDTLEQRVQERTAELQSLYQTLEEQNLQLEYQSTELSASNDSLLEEIGERQLAEDLLRRREQEFRSLAENSPDNISRYDREGRLVYMNTRLRRLLASSFGFNTEEILGKSVGEYNSAPGFDDYYKTIRKVIETGLESEVELALPDTGDGERYHLVRMVAERDSHGEVTGVLAMGRDITESKQANFAIQSSQRMLAEAQAISKLGSWDWDVVKNRVAWSDMAYDIYTPDARPVAPGFEEFKQSIHPDDLERVLAAVNSAFEHDTPFEIDHRVVSRSKGVRIVHAQGKVFRDGDGQPIRMVGTVQDITERKNTEQRLTLLNYALDHVKQGVYLLDENGCIRHVNREACRTLGYGYGELVGMSIPDIDSDCPPEDWPMYWNALKAQGSMKFERYHRSKDGGVFPVEINASYFEFDGRNYTLSLSDDITERKRIDETLTFIAQCNWQEGGESFLTALARYLGETLEVDYVIVDKLADVAGHAETVALYAKGEVLANMQYDLRGTPCENVMEGELCCYATDVQQLFPDDTLLVDMQVDSYSGIPLWDSNGKVLGLIAVMDGKPIADKAAVTSILQLVATRAAAELEREQSELALAESRQFLNEAQRIAHVGSWELDLAANKLTWSDETYRIFEIDPALFGASYEAFIEIVHPDDREAVDRAFAESLQKRAPYEIEHRLLMADGRIKYVLERSETRYSDDGKPLRSLGTVQDISARKQAEEALIIREREFRTLAESLPDNILRYNREGRLAYVNPAVEKTLGAAAVDMIGTTVRELFPNGEYDDYAQLLNSVLATGRSTEMERIVSIPDSDSSAIHNIRFVAEYGPNGEVIGSLAIGRDISERKRMEAELLSQAEFQQTILNAVADAGMQVMMLEEGRIIHVGNRKLAHEFGFSDEEIDSHPPMAVIVHPDDRERILDYHRRRVAGEAVPASYELGLVTRSGERREYETSVATVPNTNPVRVITVGKDITERKRMETELLSQADFQQTLLNAIRDVGMQMMVIENGRMVYFANPASAHTFGFSDEAIAAQPSFIDFVHPDDRERVTGYHVSRMKGEAAPSSYELGLVNSNGERREFETSVAVVPGTDPVRTIAITKDITERKRMEKALASREQELRALAESSPGMVGSFYARPDGSVCMPYVSPNIRELFGLNPEDVADDATPLLALNHPADALRVTESIAESARTMTPWHIQFRILHPTRGERWMEGHTNPRPHPDGGVIWYGFVHDITERKQAEAEKQRLLNILEQSADFVGMADMQGKLLYHNRAALQMAGLPEDADFSAMQVTDMHPAWAAKLLQQSAIPAALAQGVWRGESALLNRDGREIPVSQMVIMHRDADGNPEYTSTIMQDITERKQAENEIRALNADLEQRVLERTEELRRQTNYLRTMIDTLPMMAWLKDKDCRFLVVNQALATACSHGVNDLIGKSDLDCWSREHAEAYRADDVEVMATGQLKIMEESFIDVHGAAIWVETFKAPVVDEDGSVLGTVGLARDISERKAVEAAREAALAEAERLARLRSDFMARMSHELRTPLNGILGYTQVLQGESQLDERHAVMVNVIQKSGEHLLGLINDILDFAKIEAGKQVLSVSDIHLPVFLGNIAGIVGVNSEQKQLAFVYDIADDVPEGIRADDMRLRQVLLNLLSNAVKYTERGKVSLQVTALGPGRLRFKVRDTGIGIESGQLETIFRPFEQAGDSRNHSSGTGLGLVISRELVRLMGGEIFVTSQVGEGSSFWFDLDVPVVDVYREIMPAKQLASGYRGPRRRVLVVDDIDANRALLIDMLGRLGFETMTAANGRECLECVGSQMPDLVLLDMVMPEMDGLEAARCLRNMPGFGQTPIIAVSASASGTDVADALAAGVSAFLSKPIEMKRLMAQVGGLLYLDWIYTLPEVESPSPHRQDEEFDVPPIEEMKILHQMALEGSMRDIAYQAQYLEELDDRYRSFAGQLRKLCQEYQSKAILDLVEYYINRNTTT